VSPFEKYVLSNDVMSQLVVQHEAQIERLLSGKYFVATASTLGLATEVPLSTLTPGGPSSPRKKKGSRGDKP